MFWESLFTKKNHEESSLLFCSLEDLIDYQNGDIFLAEEYKKVADMAIYNIKIDIEKNFHDNAYRSFVPIAFMYRHSLELILKSIFKTALKGAFIENSESNKKILEKHFLINL